MELLYWYRHQLEQAQAKARVHGVDTDKEQRHYLKLIEQEGSKMSEAALKVVDTTKEVAPKKDSTPKVKTAAGFAYTTKIHLQKDSDGKEYGHGNNPKRVNSNAHKLFALYKNEMTVGDFIAAGGRASALKYDIEHGYIKVA